MLLLAIALCTGPSCSDSPGNPCNEAIAWDAVVPQPETYEVGRGDPPKTCLVVPGTRSSVDLTGTSCLDDRDRMTVQVRACNSAGCGGWSNPVEFEAVACLRQTCRKVRPGDVFCTASGWCEDPCCPGSARYLQERYPACE